VFVPFRAGEPAGKPIELLSGFVGEDGKAYGAWRWTIAARCSSPTTWATPSGA
jgi:hypothetical protein